MLKIQLRLPQVCTVILAASSLFSLFSFPAEAARVPNVDHLDFRDIFFSALDENYGEDDLDLLIYAPDKKLLNGAKGAPNASAAVKQLEELGRALKPLNLFAKGRALESRRKPETQIEKPLRALDQGPTNRLTLVLVPGIFGEFIHTRAFEEIFSKPSPLRELWEQRINQARSLRQPNTFDNQYSLEALREKTTPMEQLISVGTLDDASGRPLVNVILFSSKLLSLETMGDIGVRSEIYLRRLRKYFALMGVPEHVAFVGYSRGAMLALDMLARAQKDPRKNPWLSKVDAMVSLGGVLYGSELADAAVNASRANPPPKLAQELSAAIELRNELQTLVPISLEASPTRERALMENTKRVALNTWALIRFGEKLAEIMGKPITGESEGLSIERAKRTLGAAMETLQTNAGTDMRAVFRLVGKIALRNFNLIRVASQYSRNVRKLQLLIDEAVIGVSQLSTRERLHWWANNQIPTGPRYYSLGATMADGRQGTPEEQALAANPVAYLAELPDFVSLTQNYADYKALTGVAVNDSQVGLHKAVFSPELSMLLNPRQSRFETTFLGVLGTHHWGIALRIVTPLKNKKLDPYPRVALLKAIASAVAEDASAR